MVPLIRFYVFSKVFCLTVFQTLIQRNHVFKVTVRDIHSSKAYLVTKLHLVGTQLNFLLEGDTEKVDYFGDQFEYVRAHIGTLYRYFPVAKTMEKGSWNSSGSSTC